MAGATGTRKGCLWALNPSRCDKVEEEILKWKRKDPAAVRRSMARPESLDELIVDTATKSCVSTPSLPPTGPLTSLAPPIITASHHSPSPQPQPPIFPQPYQLFPFGSFAYHPQHPSAPHPPPPQPIPSVASPAFLGGYEPLPEPPGPSLLDFALGVELPPHHDLDSLTPSIMDFDIHGSWWEDLRRESLALDSLAPLGSTSSTSVPLYSTSPPSPSTRYPLLTSLKPAAASPSPPGPKSSSTEVPVTYLTLGHPSEV
uniref:Uncharacterized protein n=1 Tax=Eptatretus burgeri TaxID=7764 RepID=A0A8C4R2S3_EPTBU